MRGCVVGGRGRAICHCFLINAGFDMIIKSDFCINFLLIIYKNVLGNSHHVVQKHYPAGGLISVLGRGDKAAMEQVPPGPPPTSAGDFWGAPHPTVLCRGVTAGSGRWQRLSDIPADLVPGAGGRRTHGASRPLVRVQEGPGVHSGSAPGSLGLGARRGTAAQLLLCWILMNDPILSIHWRARGAAPTKISWLRLCQWDLQRLTLLKSQTCDRVWCCH